MLNQENFYDFETWARECVRVTDKLTGASVPFVLNAPQRRVLGRLEAMRTARKPIRLIMLKARQWGGSTLVQVYMAWMQLVLRRGANSVICAHVKDAASGIKGMYSRLLRLYPAELKNPAKEWELRPYEGSSSVSHLRARDCLIAVATANSPNAVRGYNFSLAHLSEVAFWGEGDREVASEIVRTVSGTVPLAPDTLVVMESTANGTGNFFHDEWQRAVRGESDKEPVFVPWYEIELYRREVPAGSREALMAELTPYERALMEERGVCLEAVAWYHDKRREYPTHEAMMAEFPSTPKEAFATSGRSPFAEVPAPEEGSAADAPGPGFAVVVPGAGDAPHIVLEAAVRGGRVWMLSQSEHRGTLRAVLAALRRRVGTLEVVDLNAPENPSPARYCARTASRLGFTLGMDEEESEVLALTPDSVAMLVENAREALSQRRVVEMFPGGSADLYGSFRAKAWWNFPAAAARLAAISRLAASQPPVSFSELIG